MVKWISSLPSKQLFQVRILTEAHEKETLLWRLFFMFANRQDSNSGGGRGTALGSPYRKELRTEGSESGASLRVSSSIPFGNTNKNLGTLAVSFSLESVLYYCYAIRSGLTLKTENYESERLIPNTAKHPQQTIH